MKLSVSIESARRIRKASRVVFWLSAIALMLEITAANFGDGFSPWFAAACVLVAALAVAAYIAALKIGQAQNGQEFAQALGGNPNRPIILFLRSFDVARSSLRARVASALGFLLQMVAAATGDTPIGDTPNYDAEEELDDAIASHGMFIAIGDKRASYGSFKLIVSDDAWREAFRKLAAAARLIVMMPGPTPSTIWELGTILDTPDLSEKTVFVMPRLGSKSELGAEFRSLFTLRRHRGQDEIAWASLIDVAASKLGAALPMYDKQGCYFRLGPDRQVSGKLELEAFTPALGKCLRGPKSGDLSIADIWQAAQ